MPSSRVIFPTQGSNLRLVSPALAGGFFTTGATWEARMYVCVYVYEDIYIYIFHIFREISHSGLL